MGRVVVAVAPGGVSETTSAVQRAVAEPVSAVPPAAASAGSSTAISRQPTIVRRFAGEPSSAALDLLPAPSGATTDVAPSDRADSDSTTALLDRVDEMMARLEERILEELERRGGRFAGLF